MPSANNAYFLVFYTFPITSETFTDQSKVYTHFPIQLNGNRSYFLILLPTTKTQLHYPSSWMVSTNMDGPQGRNYITVLILGNSFLSYVVWATPSTGFTIGLSHGPSPCTMYDDCFYILLEYVVTKGWKRWTCDMMHVFCMRNWMR